jgi:hypothetical protein
MGRAVTATGRAGPNNGMIGNDLWVFQSIDPRPGPILMRFHSNNDEYCEGSPPLLDHRMRSRENRE